MDLIREVMGLLFGENGELRQIIAVTLQMSFISTTIAVCIGIPLGSFIGISSFPGKKLLLRVIYTFMGLPPVVAGLFVFFLLSRSGPLGQYKLLYSVTAMVTAQVLLITPVATGLAANAVSARLPLMRDTAVGLGLSKGRLLLYTLYENRKPLLAVVFTGFGRAISEVGAAQLVGGNIQYKTRVMTTAIVLETNKGNFAMAAALGVLLLVIAFIIHSVAQLLQEVDHD
ncbi:ABC transporter permease [Ruminococcaceae bacterium OttesenSCG-928-A11]|nr:ABC transporter permease [Ruminococcaceae bacterium OttesenSCG-928-A11]